MQRMAVRKATANLILKDVLAQDCVELMLFWIEVASEVGAVQDIFPGADFDKTFIGTDGDHGVPPNRQAKIIPYRYNQGVGLKAVELAKLKGLSAIKIKRESTG